MTADDANVRLVDHAREARYAEALRQVDNDVLERTNFGRLTATYEDSARAVMAVADAEREQDAATIAELRELYRDASVRLDEQRRMTDEAETRVAELRAEVERQGRLVTYLNDRRAELEAMAADAQADADSLGPKLLDETLRADREEARAEAAEARLRAVEALADEWWGRATEATSESLSWRRVNRDLRAALAPATSPAEQEGDRG